MANACTRLLDLYDVVKPHVDAKLSKVQEQYPCPPYAWFMGTLSYVSRYNSVQLELRPKGENIYNDQDILVGIRHPIDSGLITHTFSSKYLEDKTEDARASLLKELDEWFDKIDFGKYKLGEEVTPL